jgi:hypothetical protein
VEEREAAVLEATVAAKQVGRPGSPRRVSITDSLRKASPSVASLREE